MGKLQEEYGVGSEITFLLVTLPLMLAGPPPKLAFQQTIVPTTQACKTYKILYNILIVRPTFWVVDFVTSLATLATEKQKHTSVFVTYRSKNEFHRCNENRKCNEKGMIDKKNFMCTDYTHFLHTF